MAHLLQVAAMSVVCGMVAAQAKTQPLRPPAADRTITVEGRGEVRVVPNEVVLTLGVETVSKDIAAAREENDRRIAGILAAAEKAGVPRERVKTEYLEIQPRYRDNWRQDEFIGYFVRRSLTITLRELAAFEPLLASSIAAGANYVHGVEFRTTELRRYRDEARRLAMGAAREKADALADAAGQRIGNANRIQEGYSGWVSPYSRWWGAAGGGMLVQNVVQDAGVRGATDSGALVPGQISVSASVSVTFDLIK